MCVLIIMILSGAGGAFIVYTMSTDSYQNAILMSVGIGVPIIQMISSSLCMCSADSGA